MVMGIEAFMLTMREATIKAPPEDRRLKQRERFESVQLYLHRVVLKMPRGEMGPHFIFDKKYRMSLSTTDD